MTVLVTSYVDPTDYVHIANTIMDYEYVHAEQAGFIVSPQDNRSVLRLEMSGGEFCGNAVLAAAAYCKYQKICQDNRFLIEASGAKSPLLCDVKMKSPTFFEIKAEMPQQFSMNDIVISYHNKSISGSLVQLEGIIHFVTNYWPHEDEFTYILEAVKEVAQDKAIGIIPYRYLMEGAYEIRPFVYVGDTGATFFERSCGSGTLALGFFLAEKGKEHIFNVLQPGGTICVEIGSKSYISTDVRITCEGIVHLPF